jgi:hypothetical protein
MKKNLGIFVLAAITLLSSCSNQMYTGNGALSDVSLQRNSSEYEIKRLNEIEVSGKSFWGIPSNSYNANKNKRGMIVRFNGLELGRTPKILPILTMVGYTFGVSGVLQSAFGNKDITERSGNYTYTCDGCGDPKLGFVPSVLLALPVAGALNNFTWSGSAFSGATNELNYRLVTDNPNVDVFLNPKYTIDYKMGFWKQSATVKAKVMGATIK